MRVFVDAVSCSLTAVTLRPRLQMSPLGHDVDRLHMLCGLVMCRSVDAVKAEAGWAGTWSLFIKSLCMLVYSLFSLILAVNLSQATHHHPRRHRTCIEGCAACGGATTDTDGCHDAILAPRDTVDTGMGLSVCIVRVRCTVSHTHTHTSSFNVLYFCWYIVSFRTTRLNCCAHMCNSTIISRVSE